MAHNGSGDRYLPAPGGSGPSRCAHNGSADR